MQGVAIRDCTHFPVVGYCKSRVNISDAEAYIIGDQNRDARKTLLMSAHGSEVPVLCKSGRVKDRLVVNFQQPKDFTDICFKSKFETQFSIIINGGYQGKVLGHLSNFNKSADSL